MRDAMSPVLLLLLLIAACSSGNRTRTCAIEPIKRTHCDAPINLAEMRTRANELVGKRVTLTAPLGITNPWMDCWTPIAAVLALVESAPPPRTTVSMPHWKCPQREERDRYDCPVPPDGRTVVVRGRLEHVLHSETNFVLHDSELCDLP